MFHQGPRASVRRVALLLGVLLLCSGPLGRVSGAEPDRMAWWREARFGLFIHWGLYALPGGVWEGNTDRHPFLGTEWIMAYRQIPAVKYKELAARFNPAHFDAEAWVLAAKDAGMKYVVFTAKHHDGFALYDSKVSDFTVVRATPFGRDVVAELAAACRKHGLRLGLYYSQAQDWTHRGGAVSSFMKRWDPAHEGSFDEYLDKVAVPQVEELLTQYGPVSVLWWDTPQDMTPERAERLLKPLAHQPGIIQNSRLVTGRPGDYRVFEGTVPAADVPSTPWEVCKTMNETWGHSTVHHEWVPVTRLVRDLIHTASLGGNLLLNVGPDGEGRFQPEAIERLKGIGEWMRVNGEAVYGTSAFRTKRLWQQGRITQKPGKLFVHVLVWPPSGTLTIPVAVQVKSVAPLSEPGRPLPFTVTENGVVVEVAGITPDPRATVLVLETEGRAVEAGRMPPLDADADGVLDLLAAYAVSAAAEGAKPAVVVGKREGTTPPLTGDPYEGFKLGGFASPDEKAVWRIRVPRAGAYTVTAHVGVRKGMPADCRMEVDAAGQALGAALVVTGDSQTFKPLELGKLTFASPGEHTVAVRFDLKSAPATGAQLWRVQLRPIAP